MSSEAIRIPPESETLRALRSEVRKAVGARLRRPPALRGGTVLIAMNEMILYHAML